MKNALFTILFIFLVGSLCHFGLPWWTLAFIGMLAGFLFSKKPGAGWFSGFAGGFLLWFVNTLWINSANGGMLAGKIGQLFMGLQGWQLMLVTGLLGGLLAGFGTLSGKLLRALFVAPKQKRYSF